MRPRRSGNGPLVTLGVGACFFVSGAAGLVYQVIWTRMLGLLLGHTVYAVTTVLAAFMAGLALGAYFFGRIIDRRGRPLLTYGLLEGGTGLFCLLLPALFAQTERVILSLSHMTLPPPVVGSVQFVLLFVLVLIPTTFMGATLPVLSKFAVDQLGSVGRRVGDLYGLNTFGAVVGVVAAGFFLLPAIGMTATTFLAAGFNLVVAAIAILLDRRAGGATQTAREDERAMGAALPDLDSGRTALIMLATWGLGLSGAASMVYEVAWTRALSLVIGSSTYAFSTMLTTFLAGLAFGSFLFARLRGRRQARLSIFGGLEVAIGFAALVLIPLFGLLPDLCLRLFARFPPSHSTALLSQFLLSFLVMIVPTTLIGATFPAVAQACVGSLERLGHSVGRLYAANTLGAIGGAMTAGFVLIPMLGVRSSIAMAAAVNVLVGTAILAVTARTWRLAVVPVLFVAVALSTPAWNRSVMGSGVAVYAQRFVQLGDALSHFHSDAASKEILYYREGTNATVAVERSAKMTTLKVNGKVDASNGIDMLTQLMLGHLPALLHPQPERVLVIGLGSGVTAGAVAQHPVKAIDVVELEPAVVEASSFFSQENRAVLRDPRVRVVIADGRSFMLASEKRYDIISSEPSNPWMAGVANLFSREFYDLCRHRLAADGIMVQWVHGYSLFPSDLRMIVNTFRQVFPHTTIWRTHKGDYLLVGTPRTLAIDYTVLRARYAASAAIREDMGVIGWDSPLAVLTLFLLDEEAAGRYAADAGQNTDDLPLLEFSAPLALYAQTIDDNHSLLQTISTRRLPALINASEGLLQAADAQLHFARALWVWGEREQASRELEHLSLPAETDVVLHIERARLLFSLGKVQQALENLHDLSSTVKDSLVASYLRAGKILSDTGFEDAVAEHGRTTSGTPDPTEALNNLGVFYNSLGIRFKEPALFDLAIDAFKSALAVEPRSYPVLNNLGNAYFEKEMWDEARETYRHAIEVRPEAADAYFNLGLVFQNLGAFDLARGEYEKAVRLRPDWTLPRLKLAGLASTPQTHSAEEPLRVH